MPQLKLLRKQFIGRIIHSNFNQWKSNVTNLLNFNSNSQDNTEKGKVIKMPGYKHPCKYCGKLVSAMTICVHFAVKSIQLEILDLNCRSLIEEGKCVAATADLHFDISLSVVKQHSSVILPKLWTKTNRVLSKMQGRTAPNRGEMHKMW